MLVRIDGAVATPGVYTTRPATVHRDGGDIGPGIALLTGVTHFVTTVRQHAIRTTRIRRKIRIQISVVTFLVPSRPRVTDVRSNDLDDALHDAGQFYWVRVADFLRQPVLFGDDVRALRLDRHAVCDIDTEEDWEWAEAAYRVSRRCGDLGTKRK